MRFINPICFSADLDRARRFYRDLMGLRILEDEGGFVRFEGGFALHEGRALHRTVFGTDPAPGTFGRGNLVLYFEDNDLDAAFIRIAPEVELIHPIQRQHWGQRVFRFHDPDGHIVEIGDPE
ncbi:glyoxalase/bleomycin resistance/extradiol dioxygenase family protein [Paracoccus aurantiacus]|uniref:Glyoxalase/bleomycin resistance/extradiol dioxygenase family protein n=1 Tax=Paracoccus aurantiacus TaxID=2599412 RepID=A0A5C6S636_9RHOB|nr:VOC family protein [Paracoccus aurantiacus]TXB69084.1 glyoxalase/bleomycin resistance/extradiol dioxygenase family protein [Paracoccus aurantiacus]